MPAPHDRFGIDPIGTAGHHTRFVLIEWPLPWPRDLFDDAALASVADAVGRAEARHEPTRVLGLVPGTGVGAPVGSARIIRYAHDGAVFARTEALVEVDRFVDEVVSVVDGADPSPRSPDESEVKDLLICTHGRRDARCGREGTRLFQSVAARWPGVRVWRTSHTGGHRFAPTGISFPEGWFWSNLDVASLDAIVSRTGDPAELADHLRGNAAMEPRAQVLDRAGWLDEGWGWVQRSRWASVEAQADGGAAVEVVAGRRRRSATVGVGREVPTTACDSACQDPAARTPELALLDVS